MKIKCFSLLAASLVLALVFTFSCSSGGGSGVGGGQYCYASREGHQSCALIGVAPSCYVSSVAECQSEYEGSIQTFAYCNANAEETLGCDKEGYPSTNTSSSSGGGSGGGGSDQYCYINTLCIQIGNSPSCYIPGTTECRAGGGSIQTLAYCNANASGVLGCDQGQEGSCFVLGTCIPDVTPSMCSDIYGGTYSDSPCTTNPSTNPSSSSRGGNNVNNSSSSGGGSGGGNGNGQYCYNYGDCDLIGTNGCYVSSTAECINDGGSLKTLEWCRANLEPDDIYGCYAGGGFEGYCLYEGNCLYGTVSESGCISVGGTFNLTSCPSSPALPSNGQYCFVPEAEGCILTGTNDLCLIDATVCQAAGFSITNLAWCNANQKNILGCSSGSSLYRKAPDTFTKSPSKSLSKRLNKLKSLQKISQ